MPETRSTSESMDILAQAMAEMSQKMNQMVAQVVQAQSDYRATFTGLVEQLRGEMQELKLSQAKADFQNDAEEKSSLKHHEILPDVVEEEINFSYQPEVAACVAIPEVAAWGLDDPCDVEVKTIGSETSSQLLGVRYSSISNNLIKSEVIVAASCEEIQKSDLVVDDQVSLLLSSDSFLIEDAPKPTEYFTINMSVAGKKGEKGSDIHICAFKCLLSSCLQPVCENVKTSLPVFLPTTWSLFTSECGFFCFKKVKFKYFEPGEPPPLPLDITKYFIIYKGTLTDVCDNINWCWELADFIIIWSFSIRSVHNDMKLWSFKVILGSNIKLMILVHYIGEEKQCAYKNITSIVLIKMEELTEVYHCISVRNPLDIVTAYFNGSRCQFTKNDRVIVGLNAVMINEPTTTVMVYGVNKKATSVGENNILILYLGGGDVSLITIEESILEVKDTADDIHISGGWIMNDALVHFSMDLALREGNSGKLCGETENCLLAGAWKFKWTTVKAKFVPAAVAILLEKDDVRESIFREILEHHPNLLKDYLNFGWGSQVWLNNENDKGRYVTYFQATHDKKLPPKIKRLSSIHIWDFRGVESGTTPCSSMQFPCPAIHPISHSGSLDSTHWTASNVYPSWSHSHMPYAATGNISWDHSYMTSDASGIFLNSLCFNLWLNKFSTHHYASVLLFSYLTIVHNIRSYILVEICDYFHTDNYGLAIESSREEFEGSLNRCYWISEVIHITVFKYKKKHKKSIMIGSDEWSSTYFNDSQLQAIKDASIIARLNVLRILKEPIDIISAYDLANKAISVWEKIVIFDPGGMTFDMHILSIVADGDTTKSTQHYLSHWFSLPRPPEITSFWLPSSFWFSSPRPPEVADLEDKVNFKERGMLWNGIMRDIRGAFVSYVTSLL